jgi:hypothetical protein
MADQCPHFPAAAVSQFWGPLQYHSRPYLGIARGYAYAGETAKAKKRFGTTLNYGKTPTRTFLFCSELKWSTPSYGQRTGVRSSVVLSQGTLASTVFEGSLVKPFEATLST